MRHIIEHQHVALGRHTVVAKIERHVAVHVLVDLMVDSDLIALEQQPVSFAGKIIAPQTFFGAHREIGIISMLFPCEWRRHIKSNPFPSKGDLARFQDNQKDHVTKRGSQNSAKTSRESRISAHQTRHKNAANYAGNYAADCHTVWNNEMLKVDKGSYDKERNKDPVRDRHLPREPLPDPQKKKRGNQFHGEIAKSNFRAAICAPTTKEEPTDQWQILMPRNWLLAVRAERPTRLVNRKIDRPPINADV